MSVLNIFEDTIFLVLKFNNIFLLIKKYIYFDNLLHIYKILDFYKHYNFLLEEKLKFNNLWKSRNPILEN